MSEADRAWDRSWEKEAVRGRDRIKELEEENRQLREAVGLASTFAPHVEMDVKDPLRMMQEIECALAGEGER